MRISIAAEGQCDIAAAKKILSALGHTPGTEANCRGKTNLDKRLLSYAAASQFSPWFVIRDLDRDAACPAELVNGLLGEIRPNFFFRIAVRSLESWLMADSSAFSDWFGISAAIIPLDTDAIGSPKLLVGQLARRSAKRVVRERMAANPETGAHVGPEYEAAIAEFIHKAWSPNEARLSQRSASLSRAMDVLGSTQWT